MQIRIKLGDRLGINLENSFSSEASLGDSMGDGQDETDFSRLEELVPICAFLDSASSFVTKSYTAARRQRACVIMVDGE